METIKTFYIRFKYILH